MPQAMSLERFAELTVRMTSGERRSDVLESAHIDLETWDVSQQYWLGKMATEAARDRYSLAQRYGVLCKAAQMRRSGASTSMRRRSPGSPQQVVVSPAAPPGSDPSRSGYTTRLTIEQLAAMRAEIATASDAEQPRVMQRFGLDAATWEHEERHWQRRLAGDQELFKRYLRQFQYCRSLLQRT
jgi:hypothetical protein